MIIIITGSRGLAADTADSFGKEFSRASQTLWDALCRDDLMIFGDARGVDTGAYEFAVKHKVPYEIWYAEWNKLTAPGAVIRQRSNGSEYNLMAGYDRNQKMIDRALELSSARRERVYCIAMWDEISKGTLDCMKRALAANIEVVCWNPKEKTNKSLPRVPMSFVEYVSSAGGMKAQPKSLAAIRNNMFLKMKEMNHLGI